MSEQGINRLTLYRLMSDLLRLQQQGWRFAIHFVDNAGVIVQGSPNNDHDQDWTFDIGPLPLIDALRISMNKCREHEREGKAR